mgnify:CR=1 FL=1
MALTDKVIIVTGGGRGIGRGIARDLLHAGAKVLVAERRGRGLHHGTELRGRRWHDAQDDLRALINAQ